MTQPSRQANPALPTTGVLFSTSACASKLLLALSLTLALAAYPHIVTRGFGAQAPSPELL